MPREFNTIGPRCTGNVFSESAGNYTHIPLSNYTAAIFHVYPPPPRFLADVKSIKIQIIVAKAGAFLSTTCLTEFMNRGIYSKCYYGNVHVTCKIVRFRLTLLFHYVI